jgi:hypothetical protein
LAIDLAAVRGAAFAGFAIRFVWAFARVFAAAFGVERLAAVFLTALAFDAL